MIRPELARIAAKVRARLQSGAALTWRDVWAMAPDASRTWAHETLRKRTTFKNRRSPILDPITAAMLGYTRRGSGWVKNQNRSS